MQGERLGRRGGGSFFPCCNYWLALKGEEREEPFSDCHGLAAPVMENRNSLIVMS